MRSKARLAAAWVCGVVGVGAVSGVCSAGSELFPWDPVALTQGREAEGREGLEVERAPYVYRFENEETKAAFEREPQKYEVQWGGACGRMGPLSGTGSSERYAVHEGRIYVFASDGCKATFLKKPEEFVAREEPFEGAIAADLASGRGWVERAVRGLGGAAALDGLRAYHEWEERTTESGGREYLVRRDVAMLSSGAWVRREAWDDSWSAFRIRGEEGVSARADGGERVLADSQREAVRRIFQRKPALLLRHRGEAGFHAVDLGESEAHARRQRVKVWFDGAATTLEIEAESGRVVAIEYAGRGPDLRAAQVRVEFSEFREVGGLMLPHAWSVTYNGDASSASERRVDAIAINDEAGVERVFASAGG